MFRCLCSVRMIFRNSWVRIFIFIRLNFWFGFGINLLLILRVLNKLLILINWFLLIVLVHCHILIHFLIIAVFMTWFFSLTLLIRCRLNLLLACFILLCSNHHLLITINALFPLILKWDLFILMNNWLWLLHYILLNLVLWNNVLLLVHHLLLNWNLQTLFALVRMTKNIILIIITIGELSFNCVVIISNVSQFLLKVFLRHFVVKKLEFLLFLRHLKDLFSWLFDKFLLMLSYFFLNFWWFSNLADLVDN